MRLVSSLVLLAISGLSTITSVLADDSAHWAAVASKNKYGIIKLDSQSYEDLVSPSDREYSVTVLLTALPASFKCQPCQEFEPNYQSVASSWKKMPQHIRDQHFFAELDFTDGQAIYAKLGLSSAPTVMFHPALSGPNKSNKLSVVTYDLNRNGLTAPPLHAFIQNLTPAPFPIHKPFNPIPVLMVPVLLATVAVTTYSLSPYILPLVQSRFIWGIVSIIMILTFTSGYMWNKIKAAPYVTVSQDGKTSWMAGGFQNQLGLESQVVGTMYGLLAFSIVVLTVFVPAQSSPTKQRIGVYIWLGMLIIMFSLLMKLFRMKNGGYPFFLLF